MKFLICILFPIFTFAQSDTLRNYNKSLGRRILRGEMLVQGGEAAGLGVLLLLPSSVTKWNEGYMTDAKRNLKRAWSKPPVFDHDDWWINYISHPVAGAYYYNALRSQNATPFQSFLFSAIQSTLWEYGLEAVAEQPSIQDLSDPANWFGIRRSFS